MQKMKLLLLVSVFVVSVNCRSLYSQNDFAYQKTIGGRIVGGQAAYPAQYPFAAAINVQTPTSRLFCVGSLLSNLWVITAGHCVNGASTFTIQLGSNSLSATDANRLTVATATYVIHPDFNPTTNEHDLGLIKFRLPITFTDFIRATDYLPTSPLLEYQNVLAIGWGQISDSDVTLSDSLKWVLLSAIPNAECRLIYGNQITDDMVCTSGNYMEGPCIGDSGGPLIHLLPDSRMALVGVASFVSSNGCDNADPAGYTRTYPYVDWIRNTTDIWT